MTRQKQQRTEGSPNVFLTKSEQFPATPGTENEALHRLHLVEDPNCNGCRLQLSRAWESMEHQKHRLFQVHAARWAFQGVLHLARQCPPQASRDWHWEGMWESTIRCRTIRWGQRCGDGCEDLVAEGLVAVGENGVKIPALCRLLYTHQKTAGITFPKMSKGKKDQVCNNIFFFMPFIGTGCVVRFCALLQPGALILNGLHSRLHQRVSCLFRCAISRSVNPNKGMYDISTFNNVPSAITECEIMLVCYVLLVRLLCRCACARYVRSHIKAPAKDRYPGLLVFEPVGGHGKTQYFLALGPCVYFRMQINWNTWNVQRTSEPPPEFLLLDDVDLFGAFSNIDSENRRKALINGTGSFDVCTRNGAYSHYIQHGLPTVMLTNEYTTWCSFQSHEYFRNHVIFGTCWGGWFLITNLKASESLVYGQEAFWLWPEDGMNRFAALHMERFGACQTIDSKMNAKKCMELGQMTERVCEPMHPSMSHAVCIDVCAGATNYMSHVGVVMLIMLTRVQGLGV